MGQQLKPSAQFPKIAWNEYKKDGNLCIFRSSNGLMAVKKQLTQDKKLQPQKQLKIYQQRSQTDLPLVKVYNAQIEEQKKNFCSITQKIIVWLQYVPNRLSIVKHFSLNEAQAIFLLQQSLKAFHHLYLKFGFFQIKQDMIGFNTHGQVRCWMNTNFQNNRVQNAGQSILGGDQNLPQIYDPKLKQTIEKSMVSQIWKIVKKRSNIQSKDLFYRISGLDNTNFQNALKLIELLISKFQLKIPSFFLFENCLQFKNNQYKEFTYANIVNSQGSNLKLIETNQKQIFKSVTFNLDTQDHDLNFHDFYHYRDHIQNLNKKIQASSQFSISFDKFSSLKTISQIKSPEKKIEKKPLKKELKIVDKTFNINLSSVPQNTSNKTIPDTEPSEKKIESQENLFLPLETIKRQCSIVVPNIKSEKYILTQMSQNLPSSRINLKSLESNSRILTENFAHVRTQPIYILQNHQPVLKRTNSRFISPPPLPNLVRKQSSLIAVSPQPFNRNFPKTNNS